MKVVMDTLMVIVFITGFLTSRITPSSAVCNKPPSILHTTSNGTGFSNFVEGTIVRYDCLEGYHVNGSNKYFLCNGSAWIHGNIRCDPVLCPSMAPPENGKIGNIPSNEAGTVVIFACDEGYVMSGDTTLLCRADGKWFPSSVPECVPKDCGDFRSIKNANISQDFAYAQNHYRSVIHVQCHDGYILTGHTEVRCEASGQWSAAPECEALPCPSYPRLNGSCIGSARILLNNSYALICKDGEDASSTRVGPQHATCLGNQWDTRNMACYCDCFANVGAKHLKFLNLNPKGFLAHNNKLQWECDGKRKPTDVEIACIDGELRVYVNHTRVHAFKSQTRSMLKGSSLPLCEENSSSLFLVCDIRRWLILFLLLTVIGLII